MRTEIVRRAWEPMLVNLALLIAVVTVTGSTAAFAQSTGGFENKDIGDVGQPGNGFVHADTGQWFVGGAGGDIWGTADAFHYMYVAIDGDREMVFRVTDIDNTHPFAKAGLMVRTALTADSTHALVNVRPNGVWEFLTRTETGGLTAAVGGDDADVPRWLRIVRHGDDVEAFVSLKRGGDAFWTSVGRTSFPMPSTVYIGLAVTSHDPTVINGATFESVGALTPTGELPMPWTTENVGDTGEAGGVHYAPQTGAFLIAGAGDDIWGTADAFRYVSQPVTGDVEIQVRVPRRPDNTHPFAKAGLMLRETLAADSPHVLLDLLPDGGIEFMTRNAVGEVTSFVAGAAWPGQDAWLRLTRSGTTVIGWLQRGEGWTEVGRVETTIGDAARVGMAVTSHDADVVNVSWFDFVTVIGGSGGSEPAEEIVIRAGDQGTSPHGAWERVGFSGAANGVAYYTSDRGFAALDSPLASPQHYVDAVFNAVADVPYTVWLRLCALSDSKWNDSVWVQFSGAFVNGAPAYQTGTTSGLLVNLATDSTASSLNAWGWANGAYWLSQPATVTFATSGPQTLRIQLREDGVVFDQIVLSSGRYLTAPPGPATNDHTIVPKE